MMESPESSGLTPRNQTNLSLPARPADRRLRQRVQVGPMMLRLPGQQFLAHAGRPVHLQMITHAEHRLFLVRFTGEVLGDLEMYWTPGMRKELLAWQTEHHGADLH